VDSDTNTNTYTDTGADVDVDADADRDAVTVANAKAGAGVVAEGVATVTATPVSAAVYKQFSGPRRRVHSRPMSTMSQSSPHASMNRQSSTELLLPGSPPSRNRKSPASTRGLMRRERSFSRPQTASQSLPPQVGVYLCSLLCCSLGSASALFVTFSCVLCTLRM
jgi:hypothetical protein